MPNRQPQESPIYEVVKRHKTYLVKGSGALAPEGLDFCFRRSEDNARKNPAFGNAKSDV